MKTMRKTFIAPVAINIWILRWIWLGHRQRMRRVQIGLPWRGQQTRTNARTSRNFVKNEGMGLTLLWWGLGGGLLPIGRLQGDYLREEKAKGRSRFKAKKTIRPNFRSKSGITVRTKHTKKSIWR